MQSIRSVNIVGIGNLGFHLLKHLIDRVEVRGIYSRTNAKLKEQGWNQELILEKLEELPMADLTIVCVKDDLIREVLSKIDENLAVVHTSGSMGLDVFEEHKVSGVFYPLQTFSSSREIDFNKVPFLIESTDKEFIQALDTFARSHFSNIVIEANSEVRSKIHISAVFAANFTTYLLQLAQEILYKENIDYNILHPLVTEVIEKSFDLGADKALTGPAIRKDYETLEKHLGVLSAETESSEVYEVLTRLIINRYDNTK